MDQQIIKLYANLILNKSISITPYTANNQTLFKYSHNLIIAVIIKKNLYKFKHEIDDFSILRDEVYASYYEALIKVITKQDYTQEDMNTIVNDLDTQSHEITQTFAKLLIGYTNNQLKTRLIDHTRRDRSNNQDSYITTKTVYDEELLKNIPQEESSEEIHTELYNLLTESQKEYVSGERIYANKDTERKVQHRIKRRVANMTDSQKDEILEQKDTREDIINNILDIEDDNKFASEIRKWQKKEWFAELLVEYVSAQHRKDFNRNQITSTTIKEYRRALFKALEGR